MTLHDFENKLKTARTLDDINLALKNYLASLHITTFSFTYYSYYPNALNKI